MNKLTKIQQYIKEGFVVQVYYSGSIYHVLGLTEEGGKVHMELHTHDATNIPYDVFFQLDFDIYSQVDFL